MTFQEMREKYDSCGAFSGWLSVNAAKQLGLIPQVYNEVFADNCQCGSENIITSTLTRIMCCDPRCSIKMGYKLNKLFNSFSIKGVGPATCATVYRALVQESNHRVSIGEKALLQTPSHVEILNVAWDDYPSSCKTAAGAAFYEACLRARTTTVTFPELIGKLGIASLSSNSIELFKGINSFDELRSTILDNGGVLSFCARRGVHAPMLVYNLTQGLADIYVASVLFVNIRAVGIQKISICMTGRVSLNGKSLTKAAFVDECNRLCVDKNGVQLYEICNTSAKSSVPFIVYSVASNSDKYRTGLQRGRVQDSFGEHDVLVTADEFYKMLGGKMQQWSSKVEELEKSSQESSQESSRESLQESSRESSQEMNSFR